MKIAASLLQVISLALIIPAVTTSCNDNSEQSITQGPAYRHKDSLNKRPSGKDSLKTDTLPEERPISADYCPPCGRG